MKWYWKIIIIFTLWRLFLFTPMLLSQTYIPTNPNSAQYTIWAYTRPYFPVSSIFLYPWANFDGVHYLTIAGDGNYRDNADGRFFPVYPYLIRIPFLILGGGAFMGLKEYILAFLVSNGIFLGALLMMYKLLSLKYKDATIFTTMILMLAFPTSFFFGSFYSEGTFLLITFTTFYFLQKKDYMKTSYATILLTLSRVVGICMVPITAYFYIKDYLPKLLNFSSQTWKKRWDVWKPLVLMPLGFLAIMLYSQFRWQDSLYVIHAQQGVVPGRKFGAIIFFPQTLIRYTKILLTVPHTEYAWWISLLEFSSFFFGAIGLWYAWKKGVEKSYIIFSLFMFLVATQSGTFNGLPRYVLVLFPVFLALAQSKSWVVKGVYLLVGLVSLFLLLAYFSKGYFVA